MAKKPPTGGGSPNSRPSRKRYGQEASNSTGRDATSHKRGHHESPPKKRLRGSFVYWKVAAAVVSATALVVAKLHGPEDQQRLVDALCIVFGLVFIVWPLAARRG